jgi:putative transposase
MNRGLPYPQRKSIRIQGFDYSEQGAYFITIITHKRKCIFGEINHGEMHLSPTGSIVKQIWESIPDHFPQAYVDHFVIMPNHIHGIIELVRARHAVPLQYEQFGKPVSGSIPTIIRSFKSTVTRQVNLNRESPGEKVWQRNYYEHVIRNERELQAIYDYLVTNPFNWLKDEEYFNLQDENL